jgi:Dyp-type peroxidase family
VIAIESHCVQGLVRQGYRRLCSAAFVLLWSADRRSFCDALAALPITTADLESPDRVINLAFTFGGLGRLGLDREALNGFPPEFQEGLAGNDHRSSYLGDVGHSAPKEWAWGGRKEPAPDALLLLYARDDGALDALVKEQLAGLRDVAAWKMLPTSQLPPPDEGDGLREHFGFRDGLSQPSVEGWQTAGGPNNIVPAGEFLLGYANAYGRTPDSPCVPDGGGRLADNDFGRNGTFLVVRQLEQDVQGFWGFVYAASGNDADKAIRLAAQIVGRWPSGAPIALAPDSERPMKAGDNEFSFAQLDAAGFRCPLGAHIRRANPRDILLEDDQETSLEVVRRHRLIRRGRPYGLPLAPSLEPRDLIDKIADNSKNRGLFFLCLNANITRQFEFVQHNWINNPEFVPSCAEQDPLLGDRVLGDQPPMFTLQGTPLRRRVTGLARFVEVIGGAYFFLPSVPALRYLAARGRYDSGGA